MNAEQLTRVLLTAIGGAFLFIIGMHGVARAAQPYIVRDAAGNSARLYDAPCTDSAVRAFLALKAPPQLHDQFRAGTMNYQGKDYQTCWYAAQNGMVYIIDEAGDMSQIPQGAFERMSES